MDTKDIVATYIKQNKLLDHERIHLLALSGGADSVALLLIMKDLGYDIEAVHCNFNLRGEESNRDENFVKFLCERQGVKLHLAHFDTKEYASTHRISIEMAARDLRYAYFEQLRLDIDAADICVAHHRDDNVETVIMNLIRGTGINGLTGIRPKNENIIRPLLCLCRNDIETYLKEKNQDYITDSSNLVDDVIRNKIRLNILPLLKDINPAVTKNIQKTSEYVREATKLLDNKLLQIKHCITTKKNDIVYVCISKLLKEISPSYVLYETIKEYGFSSSQSEMIFERLKSQPGSIFHSNDYDLLIDRDNIIIEKKYTAINPIVIIEDGTYIISKSKKLKIQREIIDATFNIPHTANEVCLDADEISFPLTVRHYKQGERFVPYGMKGSKLISDYLTDRKKTLFQKKQQLVLADAQDRIIWLINERPNNSFCVKENTCRVLHITLQKNEL